MLGKSLEEMLRDMFDKLENNLGFDPTTIDFTSFLVGDTVEFRINAGWLGDCDTPEHINLLRNKLQTYVQCIQGEEYRDKYDSSPARIIIMLASEPVNEVQQLAKETMKATGIEIVFTGLND
jgi:hypothetical protein